MSIEFNNFSEAREKWLSLKQIREAIKKLWEAERKKLAEEINNQIIEAIQKWIVIKSWDELNFLKALTLEWNTITWIDKKESDLIHPGDVIKVEQSKILKNWKHIWNVTGFLSKAIDPSQWEITTPEWDKKQAAKPVAWPDIAWDKKNDSSGDNVPKVDKPTPAPTTWTIEPEKKPANTDSQDKKSKPDYLAWVDIPSEKTDKPKYTQTYIIENWKTFLIWKNGEKIAQKSELSPESIALLKNHEKVAILSQILEIWISQANKTVDGLFWKDSRNDDEIILQKIWEVQDKFSYIFQDVQKWKNIDVNDINDIWKIILEAENEESIIWASDMEKVKWFLMNDTDNKDQKLVKIYNQMRYGWMSWNSESVKEKVATHLLNSPEFNDIDTILKNPKLLEYISNNNKAELEKILWKEMAKTILETYSKIKSKQEKHRDEYAKQLAPINNERIKAWEKEIALDDFLKLNVDLSIENILTHALLERKIEADNKRWSEKDSYKWIYANITWLWENKWIISDWILTISDNNIDTAIDISSTIAISLVSMWVWALAARWALAAATWWARATWAASLVNKSARYWGLAKFWATATVEWVAFYEGTTITNNLIYWNSAWNSETTNAKEIFKSIAFMWVLRWATKVMENAKLANAIKQDSKVNLWPKWLDLWITWNTLALVWRIWEKVPPLMFKNTSITAVLAEAGLLTSTSVWLEFAFEWEANWTWEEYLQALVMVSVIKWAWKINFSKKGGKIEAKVEEKPQNTSPKTGNEKTKPTESWENSNNLEYFKHKKTWKIYTKDSEWKFYNENWKKVNLKEENLEKIEPPKTNIWNEKVETKSKIEYIKKIGEIAALKWKEVYSSIKSKLSPSWKEKLEKNYKESDFIKDFKENLWKKIEKDYEWFKFITWTLKAPIRTAVFWAEQTWKRLLLPAWEISTALNPIKMHQNLTWSQKIVWSLVASTIAESISLATDDIDNNYIFNKESWVNIVVNAAHLATVWFWTIATEPLMNTLYWRFKWFEPRDFLPAYVNNTLFWQPMPYEMWESLLLKDKEVLEKTLKAFLDSWDYKETDYEIIELRKRISELETK